MAVQKGNNTAPFLQARARSSRPGALLPAPSQTQSWSLSCLDLASSSASVQLLRDMFSPSRQAVRPGPPEDPSTALALPASLDSLPVQLELSLSVGIGLEEQLGLGLSRKMSRTFAEVEEWMNRRMGRLKVELHTREAELELERRGRERLKSEKQEVEERAAYLSRQVSGPVPNRSVMPLKTCGRFISVSIHQVAAAAHMMEQLQKDLEDKEKELRERQQSVSMATCHTSKHTHGTAHNTPGGTSADLLLLT